MKKLGLFTVLAVFAACAEMPDAGESFTDEIIAIKSAKELENGEKLVVPATITLRAVVGEKPDGSDDVVTVTHEPDEDGRFYFGTVYGDELPPAEYHIFYGVLPEGAKLVDPPPFIRILDSVSDETTLVVDQELVFDFENLFSSISVYIYTDDSGGELAGDVLLQLFSENGELEEELTTVPGESSIFQFLYPGFYKVQASREGLKVRKGDVRLQAGEDSDLNIYLPFIISDEDLVNRPDFALFMGDNWDSSGSFYYINEEEYEVIVPDNETVIKALSGDTVAIETSEASGFDLVLAASEIETGITKVERCWNKGTEDPTDDLCQWFDVIVVNQ